MAVLGLLGMIAALVSASPNARTEVQTIGDLATCRESWLDWESTDKPRLIKLAAFLRSASTSGADGALLTLDSQIVVAGFKVTKIFPGSVGMGVGFSVMVDATFEASKQALEEELQTSLRECEASDGMRSCELPISQQRTVMLVSGDTPNERATLIGCYYLYEK